MCANVKLLLPYQYAHLCATLHIAFELCHVALAVQVLGGQLE